MYKFFRFINDMILSSKNNKADISNHNPFSKKIPVSSSAIRELLRETFIDCSDIVLRELALGERPETKIILAYIDGLASKQLLTDNIITPILNERNTEILKRDCSDHNIIEMLKKNILTTCELEDIEDFNSSIDSILSGDAILYIDGQNIALKVCSKGWEARPVSEPQTESTVRGSREGFVESIRTNTSLLRRIIKSPNFKIEQMKLGTQTKTDIGICYIKGIADEEMVDMVRQRLKKIKVDGILESGYIEQYIEDAPLSLFSTIGNSEKPDKVAGKILEGRVAILCDGTPIVLTVPYLFIEAFQSTEDYYSRVFFASFNRFIRVIAFIITVTLPAFYVALLTFHSNVVPFKLLMSIAASREGVPFTPYVEMFLMGITFEILREAGVRMPKPVGQAVSIVGALVIGESAVNAGLVSDIMVILVALTGVSTFIIYPMVDAIAILRFILITAANILGFTGIFFVLLLFTAHLCSLRSFGVPYTYPFSPLDKEGLKDSIIRIPLWMLTKRPKYLVKNSPNKTRFQETGISKNE